MPNIFKGQGGITVALETGMDISQATVHRILYKTPKGAKGFLQASVSGTQLVYNNQSSDFNIEGNWTVQAFVTIAGVDYYGETDNLNVVNTLK